MMRLISAILGLLAVAPIATPAAAQDSLSFRSPSGNIHCMIWMLDPPHARCDILESTSSFPAPRDCDLDWGTAFGVGPTGRGEPWCVGDTVADPNGLVLPYGRSVTLGPFTCSSAETGMTCVNAQGGGFTVARAAQRVF